MRWRLPYLLIPVLVFLTVVEMKQARAQAPAVGRILSIQGDVAVRRASQVQWETAKPEQEVREGDGVRTGSGARCDILTVDESQIKLNENTILILKGVAPSPRLRPGEIAPAAPAEPPASIYHVPQGEIWLRNKREKFRFELETPAVTATIRGTELSIQVGPDGTTRVILLEGSLCLVNIYGEICLRPGEQGFILPGQAPTKKVLVQPADAVQWSLYYPGIFSFRDLPLTPQPGQTRAPSGPPALAVLIQEGEAAYDQGRLREARQAAEAALRQQPDNGRALTLLGWIALQENEPEAGRSYLAQVRQTDEMAIIGLALARYRMGEVMGAFEAMQAAHRLPPNSSLVAMTGFFALLAGRVDQARGALDNAVRQYPSAVLPRAVLAQIHLVQNNKDAARRGAAAALSANPRSPLTLLTMGLVQMSFFQPTEAANYFDQAIAADPRFVDAYVYLARIWLGSDYLNRAQNAIDRALHLAPQDGTVLSLAGFIRLAFRDYEGARKYFEQAIKANPRLGEPHLGLAICHFRYRRFDQGLEEMLTATLLEPRVAQYQNELGKALYQTRSFDRALEVWDYAKTLDPEDPTPHFYKGIALSDLNRPGEAIWEIDESIAKNDNTALFRARQSLDRDLAVRNYDLAKSYDQLGLKEWAFSRAITAVKNDPYNSSAHLFLSKAYTIFTPENIFQFAYGVEDLYFRLLSPANQNTFLSVQNDNYTPMFEMPYARFLATTNIGAWRERNFIQEYNLTGYGGRPGLGVWVTGNYLDDQGFRDRNSGVRKYYPIVFLKWDPTVKTSFQGTFEYLDGNIGDQSFLNDYSYKNDPVFRQRQRGRWYDLGLVHRFSPQATFLAYYTYQRWDFWHTFWSMPPEQWFYRSDYWHHDFQVQQNLVLGKHNLLGGLDYYHGRNYVAQTYSWEGIALPDYTFNFRNPERSFTFYLFDFWRLHPKVLLELGIIQDFAKLSRDGFPDNIKRNQFNPIFGLNWYLTPRHTLRLSVQRHMMTHAGWGAFPLIPTETAGTPWMHIVSAGTDIRKAGLVWEAHWDPRTFTVFQMDLSRFSRPGFDAANQMEWQTWKTYRASLFLNRILANALGLTMGLVGQRVVPQQDFTYAVFTYGVPFTAFTELRTLLGLNFLHRRGWQAGLRTTFLQQWLKDRADNTFALVDLRLGREFPNKRGLVSLEINNLFNRHFFYALEPTFSQDLVPARRILFKLAFYY
uniref:Tetratricopeptide repeat protein n=1 Tax=Desulfobacca acetoxidans TaxID=60893 RepID=A0A7C3SLV6_9BACT